MLAHVVAAIRSNAALERIFVCIDDSGLLDADPELRLLRESSSVSFVKPGPSPAASLALALDEIGTALPLLVTTADHPLLTTSMIEHFLDHAPSDADLAVGLTDAATISSAYPDNRRTYYRLGGMGYSGCNLFLAHNAKVRRVAEYWRRMEGKRKNPLALAGSIGVVALTRFALGLLSLDGAFAHVSKLTGAKICPVVLPFAEAAIDVDKPADYELVQSILSERRKSG